MLLEPKLKLSHLLMLTILSGRSFCNHFTLDDTPGVVVFKLATAAAMLTLTGCTVRGCD